MTPELIERLKGLREYHSGAMDRLRAYADDPVLRDSDCADIHEAHVVTIDALLEMGDEVQS